MRILTRGIPNFAFTQVQQTENLKAFISAHVLKVRSLIYGHAGEYHQADSGKRVSLYIEGADENIQELRSRCFNDGRTAMKACVITLSPDESQVKSAGTSSRIEVNTGNWYMVDPELDPRWPTLLAQAHKEAAKKARLLAAQEEKDEELREQILSLASGMGYEKTLRMLKGEQT